MAKGFTKHDQEKPMMQLWPPRTLLSVGRVLTKGAKKYSADNWRKVDDTGRYVGAMFRHLVAYMMGEKWDPDDGEHHLSHLICCAAFIVELDLEKADADRIQRAETVEAPKSTYIPLTHAAYGSDPLTHYVSKSEEPGEKWADDVVPCGPWVIGLRWEERLSPDEIVCARVHPSFGWEVWVRNPPENGGWRWEEHPLEESIEAAKAAADKRLRGD